MPKTPTTPAGLRQYDRLDPREAVVKAWLDPGPRPDWHHRMKNEVRDAMPLLARALDRLTGHLDLSQPSGGAWVEGSNGIRGAYQFLDPSKFTDEPQDDD